MHVHAHGHADASHAAAVQEWPLIGWKNARSRVCRRRVCEVMVSASFYGLPRARTYTRTVRPPLRAPCKTRAHILARMLLCERGLTRSKQLEAANNYTCPIRQAKSFLDSRKLLEPISRFRSVIRYYMPRVIFSFSSSKSDRMSRRIETQSCIPFSDCRRWFGNKWMEGIPNALLNGG